MKKISAPSVILILAVFNSHIAFAESGCQTMGYLCLTECMNLNTTDRMSCYRDKQKEAEIELNSAYERLIPLARKYDPSLEKSLRGAQRAWVKFRELNCQFYDDKDRELRGGEKDDCLLRMTRDRVNEFKITEGDIGNRGI